MNDRLVDQAWALIDQGRAAEALALTRPVALSFAAPGGLLMAHAAALKAVGAPDEALAYNRRAAQGAPQDRFAWYNLAATLGDLSQYDEAAAAAQRALKLGLDAPEVWLVLGKALQGLHRYADAEQAFLAAIARRSDFAAAHLDLAQLRWMRSARPDTALAALEAALAKHPNDTSLVTIKSTVLTFAGDHATADKGLETALATAPDDVLLRLATARSAGTVGDDARMLRHAQAAYRLAPDATETMAVLCEALLADGQADAAADIAERMTSAAPEDQYALALRNTAWRITGDPRLEPFKDYAALVSTEPLDTPEGWSSLDAFLEALRARLLELHDLRAHPFHQSLRGGVQVPSLDRSPDPLARAFFAAARKSVARYVDRLGAGADPIRRRRAGAFAIAGGWSVCLRTQGFHADHVHPRGWISSAFYLDLPGAFDDAETRAGWLQFGRPGFRTKPDLPAEYFVRPERGTLALFPSCFWHGTRPFADQGHRLTIAFDVIPC